MFTQLRGLPTLAHRASLRLAAQRPALVAVSSRSRSHLVCMASAKSSGKCKWFDTKKGYGFIVPDDGSPDIFVHQTSIQNMDGFRSLAEGEPLEYVVETNEKGRIVAKSVTGPGGSSPQGAPFRPQPNYRDSGYGQY